MDHRKKWIIVLGLTSLLAAGCGDETRQVPVRYGPAPRRVADIAPPAPARVADPLAAPDPLTQGVGDRTPDALAPPDDPPASASGPKMPTDHSHWLRGTIFNARVEVRLNGLYLGQFSAPIDRDITMRLHKGVNTATFAYRPLGPSATAHLDLLESEHTPPIPPLATFRGPQAASPQPADLLPSTQTFTFLAH